MIDKDKDFIHFNVGDQFDIHLVCRIKSHSVEINLETFRNAMQKLAEDILEGKKVGYYYG